MAPFPRTLLLATDGSEDSLLAMRAAGDLAARTGAGLHIAHAWEPVRFAAHSFSLPAEPYNLYEREARVLLEGEAARARGEGVALAGAHFAAGRPAEVIVRIARELGAGLILMGSRGRNALQRLVLGSVSEGVLGRAPCPVLVMRGGERAWPPRRVVVGEDFSEGAEGAALLACRIAALYDAPATLLFAYPQPPEGAAPGALEGVLQLAGRRLSDRASELRGVLGGRPEARVEEGAPSAALLRAAEGAGDPALLAVGGGERAPGRRPSLGGAPARVVRAHAGPVLVCPVPETGKG